MFKLAVFLISIIGSYVLWQVRQSRGRSRVREIDEGRRCIACDGTDLERRGDHVRCNRCGHVVALSGLQASVVSDHEISNITKPDDRRNY